MTKEKDISQENTNKAFPKGDKSEDANLSNYQTWDTKPILKEIEINYEKGPFKENWQTEKSSVENGLKLIATQIPFKRYFPKAVLGIGGSGIVLRFSDPHLPKRDLALKFPRPVPGKVNLLGDMLKKEIAHLSELRHPGIVRILYHDVIKGGPDYETLPFYIMECIDGQPSKEFARNKEIIPREFIGLINDTAEIIRYLHNKFEHGIAHLDVKPENIVIDLNHRPIFIDLGTCKRIQLDDSATVVACTLSYAHPALARCLSEDPSDENRAQGEIVRSEIDPCWDIWSFALTVLTWLGFDRENGTIKHRTIIDKIDSYTRKYLLLLVARILAQDEDKIPN